ncbi:MAG: hypothetical protein KAY24_10220 [Candidatus Eisenbacteria sp.]|nr:hypothetical protein [Candidatus Eisenbacteria bacterium]
MKKANSNMGSDGMRKEYDFSQGVRGKYAAKFTKGTNLVLLDPDLAKLFKDSESVNNALRLLAELAKKQAKRARR